MQAAGSTWLLPKFSWRNNRAECVLIVSLRGRGKNSDDSRMRFEEAVCNRGWLSEQPEPFRKELLQHCKLRSVARGNSIFHAGDSTMDLYGVAKGALMVEMPQADSGLLDVHLSTSGHWLGGFALVTGNDRLSTIRAVSDSHIFVLPRSAYKMMITSHPDYNSNFLKQLELEYRLILRSGLDLLIRNPRARMIARLLTLAGLNGNSVKHRTIDLLVTQEQMATMSCLSRKSSHAYMKELQNAGICEVYYGGITIVRPDMLIQVFREYSTD